MVVYAAECAANPGLSRRDHKLSVTIKQHVGALIMAVLLGRMALAQGSAGSTGVAANPWSFSATVYGYIVPHGRSYVDPVFTADHTQLHLEARYNYENLETGSVWLGYNFHAGHTLQFDATPMIGGVFGSTAGVAPGYELSLAWKRTELSTTGEYVFNVNKNSGSFFYSWNELTFSPVTWFHAGLVAQHTQAYHTDVDIQRGFLVGVTWKRLSFTTYIFNPGWTDPIVVPALGVSF
jgi:hypothetical protein